ncbi:TetR/AcrR family transcriptional regulator [Paenibacillus sp. 1P07SE]|uniref:TetR/AcrR family transcriptional regulator n=1 Tax=Paenibacillus sp. 1P07SE TaxID=3132209 RepID=UPI0039A69127
MPGSHKFETSDKFIMAAIDLMSEKGYNGVTTLEIAQRAGFSEVTLFRHFKSKQNLLETAFQRYHYAGEMTQLFGNRIKWDLHADLLMIAHSYHDIMYRNRKLIMIASKDGSNLPGFRERTHQHPQQLKALLVDYFETMIQRERMVETDPETKALSFIYLNFGAAIGRMNEDPLLRDIPFDKFIEEEVWLFVRALLP